MKQILFSILGLIAVTSAQATPPEAWVSQTAICVEGNVSNRSIWILREGFFSGPGVRFVAKDKKGSVVETDSAAVMTLPVTGSETSDCDNGGKPTVLIVIFKK